MRGWEEFEVDSLWGVESIRGWVPVGIEPFRGLSPFRVESLWGWVPSGLSPFAVEFIRGWVHSRLSPFGVGSIRGWDHSGLGPFRGWVHTGLVPFGVESFLGSVVLSSVGKSLFLDFFTSLSVSSLKEPGSLKRPVPDHYVPLRSIPKEKGLVFKLLFPVFF